MEKDREKKLRVKDMPLLFQYEIGKEIGSGAFSCVKEGKNIITGEKVAVKIIDKDDTEKELMKKKVEKEIKIMKNLEHENIIRSYGSCEDKEKYYVFMELAGGGELYDDVKNSGYYDENIAAPIIEQILRAVQYLHEHGIVHRDLKLENVLYKDIDTNLVKLADFGESKREKNRLKSFVGTPDYLAPEVIKGLKYGREVDMWAVGVITYVVLCGYPTFNGTNELEVFQNITLVNYEYQSPDWDYVSEEAKNFIDSLLLLEPKDRMTAPQALEHIWIVKKGEFFDEYETNDQEPVQNESQDETITNEDKEEEDS